MMLSWHWMFHRNIRRGQMTERVEIEEDHSLNREETEETEEEETEDRIDQKKGRTMTKKNN